MKRESAWALCVVSSDPQGGTLEDQRAWAARTAKDRGWNLARVFEGVSSGKLGPRKIVEELLTALRALPPEKRPQWLLLIRLDRIGRGSAVHGQLILQTLLDLGVRVWTRDGGEEKIDSAMDELRAFVKLTVGRHENDVRREKAVNVYRRKREAGLAVGNQRAYGLRIGNDGRDEADGERAKAVALAFKLRAEGWGYQRIGARLSETAPPRVFKNGSVRNIRWTPTRVQRLLQNKNYVGPVITEAQFHAAQRVSKTLAQVHPVRVYSWPLSGAIRCYCGRSMNGLSSGPKGYRVRYYRCPATWAHSGKYRLARADDLEAAFIALLRRLRAKPSLIAAYRKQSATDSVVDLERALKRAQRELAGVDKEREAAWDLHARGKVRDDDLQPRLDKIKQKGEAIAARIESLEERIAALKALAAQRVDIGKLLRQAAEDYPKARITTQREIARQVALQAGGLCVDENGDLVVRHVDDPGRQRKRHANGR